MSEKINLTLKTKLDEKGVENFYKKLKSYNLDKEFNYAVTVVKPFIANGETDANNMSINIVPKVQYITPFVSKELAEMYMKELSTINKLMMFLPIDEEGKVIIKESNIINTINELKNEIWYKSPCTEDNSVYEKCFYFIADKLKNLSDEELDKYCEHNFGKKNKHLAIELFKEIYSKNNLIVVD